MSSNIQNLGGLAAAFSGAGSAPTANASKTFSQALQNSGQPIPTRLPPTNGPGRHGGNVAVKGTLNGRPVSGYLNTRPLPGNSGKVLAQGALNGRPVSGVITMKPLLDGAFQVNGQLNGQKVSGVLYVTHRPIDAGVKS